jgi:beta-xylosidase
MNPTGIKNIGDPFVLKVNDTYYLYATSFFKGFYVWTSLDLKTFKGPFKAYEASSRSFGDSDFWAPEVVFHQGQYIMHYSARDPKEGRLKIGVAVSKDPLGPFIDVYDKQPMFDLGYAVIDGHVFIDDDQKPYFYFVRDCSEHFYEGHYESHMYVSLLSDDFLSLKGEIKKVLQPIQAWETNSGTQRWNEGPFVLKHDNLYYLMYSANFYASKYYAIGYATATHPFGPFVKAEENPILSYVENEISGPGHNSVTTNPQGQRVCVYHVHTDYHHPSENRQVFIDPLYFKDQKLMIKGPSIHTDNDY